MLCLLVAVVVVFVVVAVAEIHIFYTAMVLSWHIT